MSSKRGRMNLASALDKRGRPKKKKTRVNVILTICICGAMNIGLVEAVIMSNNQLYITNNDYVEANEKFQKITSP